MAGLDKTQLTDDLVALFEDTSEGNTAEDKAGALADLIDSYVKTAIATVTVPDGSFVDGITFVPGTGGATLDFTKNGDLQIDGDPDSSTGGLS